jgi:hypothetical protein
MYRWAPGKRTTIRTEPAPLEMLKAAGVVTCCLREGQHPPKTEIGASAAKGKGSGEMNSLQRSDRGAIMGRAGCTGGVSGRQRERSVWPLHCATAVLRTGGLVGRSLTATCVQYAPGQGTLMNVRRSHGATSVLRKPCQLLSRACQAGARAECADECSALTQRNERVEETMPAFVARVPDRGPGQSKLMGAQPSHSAMSVLRKPCQPLSSARVRPSASAA